LANREARLRAPSGEDLSGGNAWDALRASTEMVGEFAESQILVYLYSSSKPFPEELLIASASLRRNARTAREGKGVGGKGIPAPSSLRKNPVARAQNNFYYHASQSSHKNLVWLHLQHLS